MIIKRAAIQAPFITLPPRRWNQYDRIVPIQIEVETVLATTIRSATKVPTLMIPEIGKRVAIQLK
jgi:hypothetical protein